MATSAPNLKGKLMITISQPRFPLGQVAITANAAQHLDTIPVHEALRRHAAGDWGDICPEDACENLAALVDLAGDDGFEKSVTIDFEPERLRESTTELLAALQAASDWIDAQISIPRTGIQATIQAAIAQVSLAGRPA